MSVPSKLVAKIFHRTQLLRKGEWFMWSEHCQWSFPNIKEEILRLPTLFAPIPRRPLILYISTIDSAIVVVFSQADELGRERIVYYLSLVMNTMDKNYSVVEKVVWL